MARVLLNLVIPLETLPIRLLMFLLEELFVKSVTNRAMAHSIAIVEWTSRSKVDILLLNLLLWLPLLLWSIQHLPLPFGLWIVVVTHMLLLMFLHLVWLVATMVKRQLLLPMARTFLSQTLVSILFLLYWWWFISFKHSLCPYYFDYSSLSITMLLW